ncbi:MAG: SDR family NAD(P)-dependent oxidoreductase [Chthoniobacterales bacterium]|nr:SDR family NAD(P)-dependent oxidoreductase [Chthoniobacterales bacterium]
MNRVALVVGVGPGLGAALGRRLARGGFRVALVARSPEFIDELARELSSLGQPCLALAADASRPAEIAAAVARTRKELGPIGLLVYNASSSSGAGLLGTSAAEFEETWRIAALGAFVSARETEPDMIAAGQGAMIFTGATSSVRGGGWLAFSSAKFALRGLAQSLARELWPQGIHVAHVIVDGLIGARDSTEKDSIEPMLDPDQMAEAYFQLAEQDRSAWTLELDLRPHREKFFE